MTLSLPSKISAYWSVNASGTYVRTVPTTTADPTAASFSLGFPPATAAAIAAGGTPPDIRDFNGAYQIVTQWLQWFQAGGPINYDSAYATAIGGYPLGALIKGTTLGVVWENQVASNTSNPDTGGAGWVKILPITTQTPVAAETFMSNLTGGSAVPIANSIASVLAALGFSVTQSGSNYSVKIGPVIFQCGVTSPISQNDGGQVQTFPIAFSSTPYSGGATCENPTASTGNDIWAQLVSVGSSTITVMNQTQNSSLNGTQLPVSWWAIGPT